MTFQLKLLCVALSLIFLSRASHTSPHPESEEIALPNTTTHLGSSFVNYLHPDHQVHMGLWLKKMTKEESLLTEMIGEADDPQKKDLVLWVYDLFKECQQTHEVIKVTEYLGKMPKDQRHHILSSAQSLFVKDLPLAYKMFLLGWVTAIPTHERPEVVSWMLEILPRPSPISWVIQTFDVFKTIPGPHAHLILSSARLLFEAKMMSRFEKPTHKKEIIKIVSGIPKEDTTHVMKWACQVFPHDLNAHHQTEILKLLIKMTESERSTIIPDLLKSQATHTPLHLLIPQNYPNLSYTKKVTLNWPTPKEK